ncbi:MAG TPA: signal recognition particle protein [Polyangiaceae bacterium]|jgi:signal recognition particle subunit SRP54
MFDALTKGFKQAKNRLAGLTELTEQNVESALREVRLSLLEADVELSVVKAFLARVKEVALGEVVRVRTKGKDGSTVKVTASDQFVKICHDELVEFMKAPVDQPDAIRWAKGAPTGIMMVGLQGSGKTTTCAKLARFLQNEKHKPMLVAADMQRPAAVEQLQVLGEQIGVPVFNVPGKTPLEICTAAPAEAKSKGCDVIVYDTAGRLAIDEALMNELADIKGAVHPENIYLVVDAMIGQDAVKVSRGFHDRLDITGVILTKLDGDARGGAALSIREVTGAPVRFIGMGEGSDKLEEFRPEGMASRVLGMGDVVGLMKDFEQVVDQKKAAEDAMRMLEGKFTLDDFLQQIRMIQKMGSLKDIVGKMPGMDMLPEGAAQNLDDRELVKIEAVISSFTSFERRDPYALIREPGRVKRIAKGSGSEEGAVSELVQKFLMMKQMIEGLGSNMGMLGKIPGMKNLSMANALRKMQKGGGMPDLSALGGMGGLGGLGGMGGLGGLGGMLPGGMGGGGDSMTKMKALSDKERNAKKAARKREKEARRKSRR